MKMILGLIYILGIIALGIVIPDLVASGRDVPIGAISVVGLLIIVLPFLVFSGGGNKDE